MVLKVVKVTKALKALQEILAIQVFKEDKVLKDILVTQDTRVL